MPSLQKQKSSKYWSIVYRVKVGNKTKQKWRSTGLTDYNEALKELKKVETHLTKKIENERISLILNEIDGKLETKTNQPKVNNLWELYQKQKPPRRLRERTEISKQGHIQRWIEWMQSEQPEIEHINEVTNKLAVEYFKTLNDVSGQTYNNHLSSLKRVFHLIRVDAEIEKNPWDAIDRQESMSIRKSDLSLEQVEALYNYSIIFESRVADFWSVVIALGFHTGLRQGDAYNLQVCEIFPDEYEMRLVENKKWRKGQVLAFPMHPDFGDFLCEAVKGKHPDDYIWNGVVEAYDKRSNWLSVEWNKMCKAVDIKTTRRAKKDEKRIRAVKLIGYHSLRHTYATMLEDRGVDRSDIQKVLGHGSPVMTGHYSHSLAAGRKLAGKLPSLNNAK